MVFIILTNLANGFIKFFIKGELGFSNGPESLPKSPPACPILYKWVFENFTLADEPFTKALRSLATCVFMWKISL